MEEHMKNMDSNLIVEIRSPGRASAYFLIHDYERFSKGRLSSIKRNRALADFEGKLKITKRFARKFGTEISKEYKEFAEEAFGSNFINIGSRKRGYFFYVIDGMTEDQLNSSYDRDDGFFDEENI